MMNAFHARVCRSSLCAGIKIATIGRKGRKGRAHQKILRALRLPSRPLRETYQPQYLE
jgi:hypothetical protein